MIFINILFDKIKLAKSKLNHIFLININCINIIIVVLHFYITTASFSAIIANSMALKVCS
jgi:hypothetical protein